MHSAHSIENGDFAYSRRGFPTEAPPVYDASVFLPVEGLLQADPTLSYRHRTLTDAGATVACTSTEPSSKIPDTALCSKAFPDASQKRPPSTRKRQFGLHYLHTQRPLQSIYPRSFQPTLPSWFTHQAQKYKDKDKDKASNPEVADCSVKVRLAQPFLQRRIPHQAFPLLEQSIYELLYQGKMTTLMFIIQVPIVHCNYTFSIKKLRHQFQICYEAIDRPIRFIR